MALDEAGYVTINAAMTTGRYNVVIMKWNRVDDSYYVSRCSEALPLLAAEALARSWVAATGLERR